jgi:hypothetical protein
MMMIIILISFFWQKAKGACFPMPAALRYIEGPTTNTITASHAKKSITVMINNISSMDRKPAGFLNRCRARVIIPSATKNSRIINSMVEVMEAAFPVWDYIVTGLVFTIAAVYSSNF